MEKHLQIVAILNIALGAILAFVGVIAFVFFAGLGLASGDPKAIPILGVFGTVGLLLMTGFALPGILGGIGLLQRKEWARILVIAASCVGLFAFPIGTAAGIYALWVLFDDGTMRLFGKAGRSATV
jgi:hypothetical protein